MQDSGTSELLSASRVTESTHSLSLSNAHFLSLALLLELSHTALPPSTDSFHNLNLTLFLSTFYFTSKNRRKRKPNRKNKWKKLTITEESYSTLCLYEVCE